ncbi:hypothetical protein E2C01_004028 [Portunus trituberculatus]|uniref:Uncharacterized protein n=1 Tax=Portunus trituberculatus TaxID=210409 RepID=A0A5B7CSR3_PORTR|nr:hypothetical protein [Portunus trituberculatus]
MHTQDAGNSQTSDGVCLECCDDRTRNTRDDHAVTNHHHGRRGGVSGGRGAARTSSTMQDKQMERWCSNSEILCRVFTAYLTVWLGWALPQVSLSKQPLERLALEYRY